VTNDEGHVIFDDLVIMNPRGRTELGEKHVEIKPGERVLFVGEPGAGKSTFFLAIAGIWDWGSGRISLPPDGEIMFLPQRPFIPAGSLRGVLTHADDTNHHTDEELRAALNRVGLDHLTQSLDRAERWDTELSVREQQRLALARLVLNRPKWVVSDEALDMADNVSREVVRSIFQKELSDSGVISIGSSSHGNGFYARTVTLVMRSPAETSAAGEGSH
jgi:putative ATP-binding cassette transporter